MEIYLLVTKSRSDRMENMGNQADMEIMSQGSRGTGFGSLWFLNQRKL